VSQPVPWPKLTLPPMEPGVPAERPTSAWEEAKRAGELARMRAIAGLDGDTEAHRNPFEFGGLGAMLAGPRFDGETDEAYRHRIALAMAPTPRTLDYIDITVTFEAPTLDPDQDPATMDEATYLRHVKRLRTI